jgi:hypothetical protein
MQADDDTPFAPSTFQRPICLTAATCCMAATKPEALPMIAFVFFAKPPGLWFNTSNFLK